MRKEIKNLHSYNLPHVCDFVFESEDDYLEVKHGKKTSQIYINDINKQIEDTGKILIITDRKKKK